MTTQKETIGRLESVSFPEYHLEGVTAKVDTGSYRGALHCDEIELIKDGRERMLRLVPLDPTRPQFTGQDVFTKDYKTTYVTSSSGHRERRYVIFTTIGINGNDYPIELSISKRDKMRYPVLLGRKFLHDKFLVDVTRGRHLVEKNREST